MSVKQIIDNDHGLQLGDIIKYQLPIGETIELTVDCSNINMINIHRVVSK